MTHVSWWTFGLSLLHYPWLLLGDRRSKEENKKEWRSHTGQFLKHLLARNNEFRQNRHFHQNRHLPRGHIFYPIWIASLNFWQIFPLSSKSPLSKGRVFQIRNFCQFSHFRKNRQFRHFRHYRQNRHSPRGFFWHPIWIASPLAIFRHLRHPNLPFLSISPKSPLFKGPHLASIFAIAYISGHNCVYE